MNWFFEREFRSKISLRTISYTKFLRSSGAIYRALTRSESRISITERMSFYFLASTSFCLCSCMTSSLNNSLRSHLPSVLRILLYFESCTLQLSIVSPKLSAIELPSFILCNYCKQFMAILKIQRADCNMELCCLLICSNSVAGSLSSAIFSSMNF